MLAMAWATPRSVASGAGGSGLAVGLGSGGCFEDSGDSGMVSSGAGRVASCVVCGEGRGDHVLCFVALGRCTYVVKLLDLN
jgi:hypothetical protein